MAPSPTSASPYLHQFFEIPRRLSPIRPISRRETKLISKFVWEFPFRYPPSFPANFNVTWGSRPPVGVLTHSSTWPWGKKKAQQLGFLFPGSTTTYFIFRPITARPFRLRPSPSLFDLNPRMQIVNLARSIPYKATPPSLIKPRPLTCCKGKRFSLRIFSLLFRGGLFHLSSTGTGSTIVPQD